MKKYLFALFLSFPFFAVADGPYSAEVSIFKIETVNGNLTSTGTGVLVADNKILTNCHVVEGGGWPRVIHRKTGNMYQVTQYQKLGKLDACVLSGDFPGRPVPLNVNFIPGDSVWIFGFPKGIPAVSQGSVVGLIDVNGSKSIQLNAFCAPGSSGGPVVNIKGELVGLNWGSFQYENRCLSIPAYLIRPYLQG